MKMKEDAIGLVASLDFPNSKTNIQKSHTESNEEPATELGISSNPTIQCTLRRSSSDFISAGAGAGANAASKAEVTFVTADPLSELVWSPLKGLSLKCADKLISRSRARVQGLNLGSNEGTKELSSKINNEDDLSEEKDNGIFCSNDIQGSSPSGVQRELISSTLEDACPSGTEYKRFVSSPAEVEEGGIEVTRVEPVCNEERNCDPSTSKQCAVLDNSLAVLKSRDSKDEKLTSATLEEGRQNMTSGFNNFPFLEKQEFTAENDLQAPEQDWVYVEVGDELNFYDKVGLSESSPSKSKIPLSRHDKGKTIVISEVNERKLNDEDNSDESVESCSSTRLFTEVKRRWSFEHQLVIGSKKVKKQSQENDRQDSSFMKWISNMLKGLPKSELDKKPPLVLTMGPSYPGHSNHNQSFILNGNDHDCRLTNSGFEGMFKALYCLNSTQPDNKMLLLDYHAGRGLTESENEKLDKVIHKTNSEDSKSYPVLPEKEDTSTAKCSNSHNITLDINEGQESSLRYGSSFPSKRSDSCTLSHDTKKRLSTIDSQSSLLGSAFLTRYSPKSGFTVNSTNGNNIVSSFVDGSTDCPNVILHRPTCVVPLADDKDTLVDACQELYIHAVSAAKSSGSKEETGHTDLKFKSNVTTIPLSQTFKYSEAMASVFAKRLDALRHTIPSGVADLSNSVMTCIFCGIRGHKLEDCLELSKNELRDCLKNISLYYRVKKSSCLCIRCFQINHWAISCPNTHSRKRSHFDGNSSMVDFKKSKKLEIYKDDIKNTSTDYDTEQQISLHNGNKSRRDTTNIFGSINIHLSENDLYEKTSPKSPMREVLLKEKDPASSSMGNGLEEENQIATFCNYDKRHVPSVPRGTFEAINRLRVSRTEVIKWMRSSMPHFCLEGFFLRIRLRKSDEGLEATGYYVACIDGIAGGKLSGNSNTPLSVDIGGFKCLVESQYISNQDFIEDELMAWWCATLKGGSSLPSDEELQVKLEERRSLGF